MVSSTGKWCQWCYANAEEGTPTQHGGKEGIPGTENSISKHKVDMVDERSDTLFSIQGRHAKVAPEEQ
jgi:hypothetical protein